MKTSTLLVLSLAVSQAVAATVKPVARQLSSGESCNEDPLWCGEGLSCVGNVGNMKCFAKKMLGMECGKDPFWVCEDGLLCENEICVKAPIGTAGACNDPDDVCEEGLSCVGNVGNMKCFAKKKLGMTCGKDPFWVCEDGLICQDDICAEPPIGTGGACNDPDDVCEEGLSCVGNVGNMKCFAKRMLGMRCGQDPFWVCEDGLICQDDICAEPPIGTGGACNDPDDVCEEGLSCVGNVGNMKCFAKRMLGMRCGQDPFWVCEDGLICQDDICVEPPIGTGGACNDPDDVCEEGLSCVGNVGNMKCFAKKKLGMRCGQDPFWVCEDGLICEDNICAVPTIGTGGACNEPDDVCEEGLSCVGNVGNMKCFAKKKLGMTCGKDPFWVCEDGLLCEEQVCVKPPIGRRGSCNGPDDVCADGLSCVGNEGKKKCFPLRKANKKCGRTPFQVCAEGLVCEENRCKIGKGGSCKPRRKNCASGLSCVGNRRNQRCFAKRKLGESCGQDPFWVCEDGLNCKDMVCVAH